VVTTQALEILATVPKLLAAVVAVAGVVLVVGFAAAALAGAGCQVQV
jgi:energy-converting hydrogenase Eha subunit G